jgi:predicted nucleotidyltransferase
MTLEDLLSQLMELAEKGENVQAVGKGYDERENLSVRVLVKYNDRDKEFVATFTYVEEEDGGGDEDTENWEPCHACEVVFRQGKEWHAHYPADAVEVLADDIRERLGSEGYVYLRWTE